MTVEVGEVMLTAGAARELTDEVKADAAALWTKLLALYEGQAHVALGYTSWGAYYEAEFGGDYTRGYQLLDAAKVRALLSQSTNVDWVTESQAREMAPMLRKDPAAVPVVWQQVQEMTGGAPTAAVVRSVVRDRMEMLAIQQAAPVDPAAVAMLDRLARGETVVLSARTDQALIYAASSQGRYVLIDRRSDWGNPFEMPADGDRATVIANYRNHYLPNKPSLLARLDELRGKALGCWCAPEPCHGDVLVEALSK